MHITHLKGISLAVFVIAVQFATSIPTSRVRVDRHMPQFCMKWALAVGWRIASPRRDRASIQACATCRAEYRKPGPLCHLPY
jgi:hypothetical protein